MTVWHVYGHTVPGGDLQGAWATLSVELRTPREMLYTMAGMPYLASFDHEPNEDELDILRDAHEAEEAAPLPDVGRDECAGHQVPGNA